MSETAQRDAAAARGPVDRYFAISARGSTVARELRGGLVTFMTMAYIVVLNPIILGNAPDMNGTVLGPGRVAAVTALVAGVLTILMGVVGRYPLALAAGLGINGFVAGLVISKTLSWPEVMGLVVIEGVLVTILVVTGFRTAVFNAIPRQLKTAISVGIGLFIALIGFVDAGFVSRPEQGTVPLQLGVVGQLTGWPIVVFVFGVLLMAVLVARKTRGAILIAIVAATVLAFVVQAIFDIGVAPEEPGGWSNAVPAVPTDPFRLPDLSLIGDVSLFGSFTRISVLAVILLIFSLMLSDFFDTMGTVVGVGAEANLLDEHGRLPGIGRVLFVDSIAAIAGGASSVSSNTTYVESTAGVGEGARTGLASIVTGLLFLLAIFLAPLVEVIPSQAAAPALVVVGFLMMTQVTGIDWKDSGVAIPAFLTIVVMPFTYSIANGIGAGFVSYVVIRVAQRRAREIHPLMWVVGALFALYFAIAPIEKLLGLG
ncbi:MAG: NCS2 family permease [Streptosporangiales bacterium]|nr:NCS2 family permease [Streptosporangiales bacterium]